MYIVLVNYRSWQDTVECLHALEQLEYANHRVVVLDNASGNDSVERIRQAFPKVELVALEQNHGFSGGNNIGIRRALEAGAEFVWLLNPDTKPDPGSLQAMVRTASSDPKIGAVGNPIYEMEHPERPQVYGGGEVYFPTGLVRHHWEPDQLERLSYIGGMSLLVPRAAFERVGLLDEQFFMYFEDTDFGLRLRKAGFILSVAQNSRVLHRGQGSWGPGQVQADYHLCRAAVRFYRKHAPFPTWTLGMSLLRWTFELAKHGSWSRVAAYWRGARDGLRQPV